MITTKKEGNLVDNRTTVFTGENKTEDYEVMFRTLCGRYDKTINSMRKLCKVFTNKRVYLANLIMLTDHFNLFVQVDSAKEKFSIWCHDKDQEPIEMLTSDNHETNDYQLNPEITERDRVRFEDTDPEGTFIQAEGQIETPLPDELSKDDDEDDDPF